MVEMITNLAVLNSIVGVPHFSALFSWSRTSAFWLRAAARCRVVVMVFPPYSWRIQCQHLVLLRFEWPTLDCQGWRFSCKGQSIRITPFVSLILITAPDLHIKMFSHFTDTYTSVFCATFFCSLIVVVGSSILVGPWRTARKYEL